jgi:hypothetical protein
MVQQKIGLYYPIHIFSVGMVPQYHPVNESNDNFKGKTNFKEDGEPFPCLERAILVALEEDRGVIRWRGASEEPCHKGDISEPNAPLLHVLQGVAEAPVLKLVDAYLEGQHQHPESSVQNEEVLAALEPHLPTLGLELILRVDPQPIVKSLPVGQAPVHGQDALPGLCVRLGCLARVQQFLKLFPVLFRLIVKQTLLVYWGIRSP